MGGKWKVAREKGLNVLERKGHLITLQTLAILWYVDVTIYTRWSRCKSSSHAIASLETRVR